MVQSRWGSKNVCQVPGMNEALEMQGQMRITPCTPVQDEEGILIQVERSRIV